MMKITLVAGDRLTQDHIDAWSHLQREDPTLCSPFLRPEFTQAVAAVRDDVEVAVLKDGGEPVGFFPFQRVRRNIGKPVGGPLSDCQAVVVRKGLEWQADELMRGCGLAVWDFSYLLTSQKPFQSHCHVCEDAVYADLSGGFDAYLAQDGREKTHAFKEIRRRIRKIQRELGPLRLELHCDDDRVFEALVDWKAAQYPRTNKTDVFAFPWAAELLERIRRERTEAFSGMTTALYAGDRLLGVHLGMRSYGVLHSWFPAYNRDLQQYSPGMVLWVEMAKAGVLDGIQRIDMGKIHDHTYKTKLMSSAVAVGEGFIDLRPLRRALRTTWSHTYYWLRSSRLREPLRAPAAMAYRFRQWAAFR